MRAKASQITSLMIVYSTVYSVADQRKHQSSASLAFVRRIHRCPVNSPHKGLVTRIFFRLITSSCEKTHLVAHKILRTVFVRSQIAKLMGPTWGPPGSCRPPDGPHVGPMNIDIRDYAPHISFVTFLTSPYEMTREPLSANAWWCPDMEIFSVLLVVCEGKSPRSPVDSSHVASEAMVFYCMFELVIEQTDTDNNFTDVRVIYASLSPDELNPNLTLSQLDPSFDQYTCDCQ